MPIRSMRDVVNRVAEVHQVPRRSILASVSLASAVFIASAALTAVLGSRWGFLHFSTGFFLLRLCVYGALVTGLLSLVSIWITLPFRTNNRGFTVSIFACLISAAVIGIPLKTWVALNQSPPINDVTTDMADPPEYRAITYFRPVTANDVDYSSKKTDYQRQFYPDLEPILAPLPFSECIKRSIRTARSLDWTIRAANWKTGRIEATDRTFWFGFRDDISIRISEREEGGCEVDVRSSSRYGKGDAGRNAERIRQFTDRFNTTD